MSHCKVNSWNGTETQENVLKRKTENIFRQSYFNIFRFLNITIFLKKQADFPKVL